METITGLQKLVFVLLILQDFYRETLSAP